MKGVYFSENIVDWYAEHRRDLPWRRSADPYQIWLSEIILQQTRVAQGLSYYNNFLKCYPDVKSLAKAKEKDVLRLWQGLGYYSRARNMLACARRVVKENNSEFPHTREELKRLPGIGDYTASAIASMAFQEPVGVVDGNVYRVLSRIFGIDKDIASPAGKKFFQHFADSMVPAHNPGRYNQAVMEFGALHCLPQKPNCAGCIFRRNCYAFQHEMQHLLPVKVKNQKTTNRHLYYFVIQKDDRFLMRERNENDIWRGLYDFPLCETSRRDQPAHLLKKFLPALRKNAVIRTSAVYRHILTHQVIFARFIEIAWPEKTRSKLPSGRWYRPKQIAALPKPQLIVRFFGERGIL